MSDNLDRYLPEFDEEETRAKLVGLTREQLVEMLIYDYKLSESSRKVGTKTVENFAGSPTSLLSRLRYLACPAFSQPTIFAA